jgi:hypothetical protein
LMCPFAACMLTEDAWVGGTIWPVVNGGSTRLILLDSVKVRVAVLLGTSLLISGLTNAPDGHGRPLTANNLKARTRGRKKR